MPSAEKARFHQEKNATSVKQQTRTPSVVSESAERLQ